jgi:hypothetical protein
MGLVILILIGIIILIVKSGRSNSPSNNIPKPPYSDPFEKKTDNNKTPIAKPVTISTTPTKINSKPYLKANLVDGEYRYFENHFVNGVQYTFGFPKENCPDKRVWIGINKIEIERISYYEAMQRIKSNHSLPTPNWGIDNYDNEDSGYVEYDEYYDDDEYDDDDEHNGYYDYDKDVDDLPF